MKAVPNAHSREVLSDGTVVEVWAGGPCVMTKKRCPMWSVRRPDGTGVQSRGASRYETAQEAADAAWDIAMETRR